MQKAKKRLKIHFFPKQARSKILLDLDPSDIEELCFVVSTDFNNSLTGLKNTLEEYTLQNNEKTVLESNFFLKQARSRILFELDPSDIEEL